MRWSVAATIVLLALAAAGCRMVEPLPKGKSPLLPLTATSDAVTLEIFSAPMPLGDPQLESLWREVDEQQLEPELRQKLAQSGIQAGVVGPALPAALANILKVTDQQISAAERSQIPIETEPGVSLLLVQPRNGERRDLVASQAHDEMHMLQLVDGLADGKTYRKAECRMVLRAYPEPGGKVRVELAPEIQHGEFRSQFSGSDAMMIMRQERQKKLLPELKMVASLSPGQMLVVTCVPDSPGSVGHYFFKQTGVEKTMQKVYVLRVSQAAPDRSFWEGPPEAMQEIASDLTQ